MMGWIYNTVMRGPHWWRATKFVICVLSLSVVFMTVGALLILIWPIGLTLVCLSVLMWIGWLVTE